MATDGQTLWVTDDSGGEGQVFVYSTGGALLGDWQLDPGDAAPTGIALDSNGSSDLWVVDHGTDRVYRYAGAEGRRTGSQSAADSWALGVADVDPQGIVDPGAPTAGPASYSVLHDRSLHDAPAYDAYGAYRGLLSKDSDPNGRALTLSVVTQPQHGTLTQFLSDGTFTYVPAAGFVGTDTFTYRVYDGVYYSNTANVTIAVTDHAPIAGNASYSVLHDRSLHDVPAFGHYGLLGNASDADGDSLQAAVVAQPQHGSLTQFLSNGTFTYVPAAGFVGTDTFTYRVYDGVYYSNTANVTIAVTDHAPIAGNASYSVLHDRSLHDAPAFGHYGLLGNASDADGDSLQAAVVAQPQHGSLTQFLSNGTFTYVPAAGFVGTDTFTYKVNDGDLDSNTATVTIAVTDHAPTAGSANYSVPNSGSLHDAPSYSSYGVLVGGLLSKTADADSDPLALAVVAQPQHGSLTQFLSNGTFTYVPAAGFVGTDTFTYKVNDGALNSNVATVSISVLNGTFTWTGGGANNDWSTGTTGSAAWRR